MLELSIILAAAGLSFRLVSTRLPYRRAGLQFGPGPDRGLGLLTVDAGTLRDDAIHLLLADASIDVSIGPADGPFTPVDSMDDLFAIAEAQMDAAEAQLAAQAQAEADAKAAADAKAEADAKAAADAKAEADAKAAADAQAEADAKAAADAKAEADAKAAADAKAKPAKVVKPKTE